MAGGEGSRLRPLTCNLPKPMVPVANRPMMEYCVTLLKRCAIREIGVTLRYLPELILDYFSDGKDFGVEMRYFIEDTPLGTAGSVKNAASFLSETFVVISGDALTDIDLNKAVKFHRKRGAMATIVLTRVSCPLEYGVVITGEQGRIRQFLEKPGWGEVFSDTVNTGIYVLEPEIFNYLPDGRNFDFSKDLFPLLLKEKKPLYGYVADGYWCDIGGLEAYLQAHRDILSSAVRVELPGKQVSPGIWVEEGALVHPDAKLEGPVVLGKHTEVGAGVGIGEFSVLGRGCTIQTGASIKRSVVWDHCFIGRKSALRGAILGNNVQIQEQAGVYEGAVIGDSSVIKERGILKPGVKLWPHKTVDVGATVHESLVWGNGMPQRLFGAEGICGMANLDITPEFVMRLGGCFGSVLGEGTIVGISSDVYPVAKMIKSALSSGLQSVGVRVADLGDGTTPMHRFGVRAFGCGGGVHVLLSTQNPEKLRLVFTDAGGGNITRGVERKIEQAYYKGDFARKSASGVHEVENLTGVADAYLDHICAYGTERMKKAGLKVVLLFEEANFGRTIPLLGRKLGLKFINFTHAGPLGNPRRWHDYQETLPAFCRAVVENGADCGAVIDANADHLVLVDERGRIIQDDLFTAILALVALKLRGGPVVVPVTAPRAIDAMAARYRSEVIRTKFTRQDLWRRATLAEAHEFLLQFDALAALVHILSFITAQRTTIGEMVDEVPAFFLTRREVPVSWEEKGTVIRKLIEEKPPEMELIDGVKVFHPDGWALILPDPEEPVCRVFSEGASMEIAESLTDFYTQKIKEMLKE
jgi:mannose-1-phosphate guanylyltransferase/phosphomannomutase